MNTTEDYTEKLLWEEIQKSNDIFKVNDYRKNNPNSSFKKEIDAHYEHLRKQTLTNLQGNNFRYRNFILDLIQTNIFNVEEFINMGLMTKASWETLKNRNELPQCNLSHFDALEENSITEEGAGTDVYFVGTPAVGKTSIVMGLLGASGKQFSFNNEHIDYTFNCLSAKNYPYYLLEHLSAGLFSKNSRHSQIISGNIHVINSQNRQKSYPINLIDTSAYFYHIADKEEALISSMHLEGDFYRYTDNEEIIEPNLIVNRLCNKNRKIIFIVVNPNSNQVRINYVEDVKDKKGNIIDQRIRLKYLDQRIILARFVSLFELPENQNLLKCIDAIHIIVSQADTLHKDCKKRDAIAQNIIKEKFSATMSNLSRLCKRERINRNTNFEPQIFTFSLGKMYLGDIYEYDASDSLQLIQTMKSIIQEEPWWKRLFK